MTKKRSILARIAMIIMAVSLISTLTISTMAAPVTTTTTLPVGQSTFSIDIYVNESSSYAGIDFALTINDESAVTFASFTPKLSSAIASPFMAKDGKHYFGFNAPATVTNPASNIFPAGEALAGTLNFTGYTGTQALTITIVQMKVTRINENKETVTTEKESPAYVFTVQRAGHEAPIPATVTVTVTPNSLTIPSSGTATANASAVVRDAGGTTLTGQTVTWSLASSYAGVSINSTTGVVTVTSNAASGSVTVRGTCGAVSGTATLTLTGGSGSGDPGTGGNTFTVTFNLAGGTRTGGGQLTQTVSRGSAATAPTVTRDGYT